MVCSRMGRRSSESPASEMPEIIRLAEQSAGPVRRMLDQIGIPGPTFNACHDRLWRLEAPRVGIGPAPPAVMMQVAAGAGHSAGIAGPAKALMTLGSDVQAHDMKAAAA